MSASLGSRLQDAVPILLDSPLQALGKLGICSLLYPFGDSASGWDSYLFLHSPFLPYIILSTLECLNKKPRKKPSLFCLVITSVVLLGFPVSPSFLPWAFLLLF